MPRRLLWNSKQKSNFQNFHDFPTYPQAPHAIFCSACHRLAFHQFSSYGRCFGLYLTAGTYTFRKTQKIAKFEALTPPKKFLTETRRQSASFLAPKIFIFSEFSKFQKYIIFSIFKIFGNLKNPRIWTYPSEKKFDEHPPPLPTTFPCSSSLF